MLFKVSYNKGSHSKSTFGKYARYYLVGGGRLLKVLAWIKNWQVVMGTNYLAQLYVFDPE